MKDNKELIKSIVEEKGYVLGIYQKGMQNLNRSNLKKVIERMFEDSTDIDVYINRRPHVVEVVRVDREIDFHILTKNEYIGRYGNQRWEEDRFGTR